MLQIEMKNTRTATLSLPTQRPAKLSNAARTGDNVACLGIGGYESDQRFALVGPEQLGDAVLKGRRRLDDEHEALYGYPV
jgi:hypothetical protein